jgi:hypothetical protein
MRPGVTIALTAVDRRRLGAIVGNRNVPQKHAWRAEIVLLTADGLGTVEITCAERTELSAHQLVSTRLLEKRRERSAKLPFDQRKLIATQMPQQSPDARRRG